MSFGFSIGDLVTVIQLANKVRKDFTGAPSELKAASDVYVDTTQDSSLLTDVFIEFEASRLSSKTLK
jgi:hypothetical protein